MERTLIISAARFIGSHLAAELPRRGLVRDRRGRQIPGQRPGGRREPGGADRRSPLPVRGECDITVADLAIVCEGVRAVFHLAGLMGVRRSWADRFGDYLNCNVPM
jgi:nucleoside-diphosphate-sugar epimerase